MADQSDADLSPLSAILRDLSDARRDVSIQELVELFGSRSFGAILFIFAVACALPLPPGSSSFLGLPLALLSPQVALGARAPWLPKAMRRRTIDATTLRRVCTRLVPTLERIERVSRPRWPILFGPVGGRVIGATCTLLSLVLILPIPLGNVLPAAAVAAFSLSLIQRDGPLAVLGFALTAASTAVLVIAARIVIRTVQHLLVMASGG